MHIGERRREQTGLAEWLRALLIALVSAVILTQAVIVNAQVPTESMEDTIYVGDRVIGLRPAYAISTPQRQDIIIFKYPDDETQLYVKRVIGLPGDTVVIRAGKVYLNGASTPLDEPYVKSSEKDDYGPYTVPENCYFVMGDNRDHSWDSRFWDNTYVAADKISGRAVVRVFPAPEIF